MNNIINSDFVNWLIKFALSKGGFLVSAAVTFIIVHLGLPAIVPKDDLAQIQQGLNAGGMALLAAFYAWISSRHQQGVMALQIAHNEATPSNPVVVDGIAGNATVKAVADASNISAPKLQRILAAQ